jgi:hypothetical protein
MGANVQLKSGKVLPLPGLLDHRTFERTKVNLGILERRAP